VPPSPAPRRSQPAARPRRAARWPRRRPAVAAGAAGPLAHGDRCRRDCAVGGRIGRIPWAGGRRVDPPR